jgi:hypothetical protein
MSSISSRALPTNRVRRREASALTRSMNCSARSWGLRGSEDRPALISRPSTCGFRCATGRTMWRAAPNRTRSNAATERAALMLKRLTRLRGLRRPSVDRSSHRGPHHARRPRRRRRPAARRQRRLPHRGASFPASVERTPPPWLPPQTPTHGSSDHRVPHVPPSLSCRPQPARLHRRSARVNRTPPLAWPTKPRLLASSRVGA